MTAAATIEITLISHTNAGKTTLARTLLGRDIGEVRDAPHVTDVSESHTLITTDQGDLLRLWDTPGFGDTTRLVARLRSADNPIGWLLREVWDRWRDRPFWCSQQAVRTARDASDVVLYLVNAAEQPHEAGYLRPEIQVLGWIERPTIVLLNQIGPPRSAVEERAEIERWRTYLAPHKFVGEVLALDAFARCWVQERVLLDAIGRALGVAKQPAFARLLLQWDARNSERLASAMQVLAEQLVSAARDREPLDQSAAPGTLRKVLQAVGVGRDRIDAAREHSMAQLAERLDREIRRSTDRLIALHGLDGAATQVVLERLQKNYARSDHLDEGRVTLWSGALTGALSGLKADVVSGGLTLGAGMLIGSVVGGLAGLGIARGYNKLGGADKPDVHWSEDFLNGLARSALLRYLAVAHFGRGRGRYVEGEAPAFWMDEVASVLQPRAQAFRDLWKRARTEPSEQSIENDVAQALTEAMNELLSRLYPAIEHSLRHASSLR